MARPIWSEQRRNPVHGIRTDEEVRFRLQTKGV